jgi:hypothetical protein
MERLDSAAFMKIFGGRAKDVEATLALSPLPASHTPSQPFEDLPEPGLKARLWIIL